ncbi:MAG TPA: 16S rRNA (cytosine(967)-C(5))-methyltransferase RsmB [Chthoniobacterales bacterium]|nr:16S rRNA (cytosine(967)-C(5))-methyltransferase RsmB [Chthoniobacterales bacterium]
MRKTSSRSLAFAALQEWRGGKKFADAILGERLRAAPLDAADRAFATELFYGVLRNLTLVDYWIGELRSGHLDHDSRDLLRLGLYQLFLLQTAEHAAIYETVELADRRSRTLVNGVLRNAVRSKADLLQRAAAQDLSVRRSHPRFLIDRWNKTFGTAHTERLCEWNNEPAPIYARINRLKISDNDFLTEVGSAAGADRTPQGGVATNFVRLPGFPTDALAAGHCYIQDPSTAASCTLLDPQPGERVLDACAAPGGKTGILAELMQNEGFILACDRDQRRVEMLGENLDRLGVAIAQPLRHDWMERALEEAPFDRILLDAPCSNTGVMRRRVDVRWRLTPSDFARMHTQQLQIVRALLPLLRPGGTLVYSTCSLEPEENEQVVHAIGTEFSFLEMIDEKSVLPFRDGFDGAYAAKLIRQS